MLYSRCPNRGACLIAAASLLLAVAPCCAQELAFRMPVYPDGEAPPPRPRAEVEALLAGADEQAAGESPSADSEQPLRIVLVAGPKDHQRGEHDYPNWQQVWAEHLPTVANTEVQTAWEFPAAEQMDWADVIVFYQRGRWNDERAAAIDPFLARGGGLVYIHWAVDGQGGQEEMAQRIGLASLGGSIKFRHGQLDIDFSPGADHPVARNFDRIRWIDETYWRLTGDSERIDVIGTSMEEGEPWPQFWTVQRGRGRVFVSIPGHYMWTFDDPAFRVLLLRGIAWTARRDVDRFNELVVRDARIE